MNMNHNEQKLNEIYELVKEGCISVYLTGSRTYPFCSNPHDYDYLFVYESEEKKKNAFEIYKKNYSTRELRSEYNLDIHFAIPSEIWYWGVSLYFQCIKGKDDSSKVLKILDDKFKFITYCKNTIDRYKKAQEKTKHLKFYALKPWYLIFMVVTIIKNNSYDFNEEEIETFNLLHDTFESEEKEKIIDSLIIDVENMYNQMRGA